MVVTHGWPLSHYFCRKHAIPTYTTRISKCAASVRPATNDNFKMSIDGAAWNSLQHDVCIITTSDAETQSVVPHSQCIVRVLISIAIIRGV